jgi:hypothetical protein
MSMKQKSFAITGFELVTKRTHKREFLDEITWWCRGPSLFRSLSRMRRPARQDACPLPVIFGVDLNFDAAFLCDVQG